MLEDSFYIKKIINKIQIPTFPDDYIPDKNNCDIFKIQLGTELFMYRKDENTILVIDGISFPFDDPFVAKYYYFNSILENNSVIFPSREEIRKVIKKFERKMDEDRIEIESVLSTDDTNKRKELLDKLGAYDRYFFLLFYDEILN